MEKAPRFRMVAFLGAVVLVSLFASAQDWPQWRGANRDAKVVFTAPAQWPEQLSEKWKAAVGSGDATPALVGDKLYVFTRQDNLEITLCLDAKTGQEIWKDKYDAQAVTGAAARHPGPRSSLAVGEGKVVTLGVGGVLSCLDAGSGNVLWRKDPYPNVVPRFFTAMSPLITDGMVVAHLGGQGNGALMAFALSDGEQKWACANEAPDYASPVLMTVEGARQIVTLSDKSIIGVSLADGKLLWELPFVPQGRAYNAATPIVDGGTVIYTGAGRGTFAVKIEKEGDNFVPKPLWSNPDIATQYNTPILKDGLLFGVSNSGNLFCLDAKTGQTKWVDPVQRDRSGFATLVDVGSALIALPSNGQMLVFKPSGQQYEQTAQIQVSETPVYAYPILTDNQVFIRNQDSVIRYTVE